MTEQGNVAAVRSVYAAFTRGDIHAVLEGLTDDVEWILPGPAGTLPFAGVRRGRAQVLQFFAVLAETLTFEQFTFGGGKIAKYQVYEDTAAFVSALS